MDFINKTLEKILDFKYKNEPVAVMKLQDKIYETLNERSGDVLEKTRETLHLLARAVDSKIEKFNMPYMQDLRKEVEEKLFSILDPDNDEFRKEYREYTDAINKLNNHGLEPNPVSEYLSIPLRKQFFKENQSGLVKTINPDLKVLSSKGVLKKDFGEGKPILLELECELSYKKELYKVFFLTEIEEINDFEDDLDIEELNFSDELDEMEETENMLNDNLDKILEFRKQNVKQLDDGDNLVQDCKDLGYELPQNVSLRLIHSKNPNKFKLIYKVTGLESSDFTQVYTVELKDNQFKVTGFDDYKLPLKN